MKSKFGLMLLRTIIFGLALFITNVSVRPISAAELYVNVLAVNGNEEPKEKEIRFDLPPDLSREDIIDTSGLELDYDINKQLFFVKGKVSLGPKESKTFKVLIKDIWQVTDEDIKGIQEQIDASFERMQKSEFADAAKLKRESLLKRLEFLKEQREKSSTTIEGRINNFRTYRDELTDIRSNSVSVKYWRAQLPEATQENLFTFVIKLENDTEKEKTEKIEEYLPKEVKPEHLIEYEGFDITYDPIKKQSVLTREAKLNPNEKKEFKISILDIWSIADVDIENLKERTREAYRLLEKTSYANTAEYLAKNIKKRLDAIETVQDSEKSINEYISAYRINEKNFDLAKTDVESLEELLEAVRENLERSKVKNVLQRIASTKAIAKTAKAMLRRIAKSNALKIIIWVIAFVGVFTFIHFLLWGIRSKKEKVEAIEEDEKKEEDKEEKQE